MGKINPSAVICFLFLPTLVQSCFGPFAPSSLPLVILPKLPLIDVSTLPINNPVVSGAVGLLNKIIQHLNDQGQKIFTGFQALGGDFASNFIKAFQDLADVVKSGNPTSISSLAKLTDAAKSSLQAIESTFVAVDKVGFPSNLIPLVMPLRVTLGLAIKGLGTAAVALNVLSYVG